MTALGSVVIGRAYFACRTCGLGGYFVDRILGLQGYLTRQATRLVCLLAGQNSFAVAERLLVECCGWKVSDETIRRVSRAEASRVADFRANSSAVAESFAAAAGDVEFQTDAAKVNTTGGWRDMKIGIFARRERGESATSAEWDDRDLPVPTIRVGFAAIEPIDDFAPHWRQWADRLGITDRAAITVLGDGMGGSGTRRRSNSATAPRSSTSTTLPNISPMRAKSSSARKRLRRRPFLRRAAACCCPTAGPGCATTSGRP